MKKFAILAVLMIFALALVTACGGSSDDEPTTSPSPSPSPTPATGVEVDPEVENGYEEVENGYEEVENGEDYPENGEDDPENGEDDPENGEDDPENGEEVAAGFVFATVPARPAGVVYSLSTDVLFQSLPVNTVGAANIFEGGAFGADYDGTPYITTAGSPTYRTVANPRAGANVGLSITNREQPHYSIDLVWSAVGINTSANSYEVTVYGSTGAATTMRLAGAVNPWAGVMGITEAADGAFTLQGVVTAENLEAAGASGMLRIHSNDTTPFNIYEIVVRRVDLVVPTVVDVALPANAIWALTMDGSFQAIPEGTTDGAQALLGPTPHLMNAGGWTGTIVSGPYGNALQISDRGYAWHSLDIMFANLTSDYGLNTAANSYTVTVHGVTTAGNSVSLVGRNSPWDNTLGTTTAAANGNFTVTGTLSTAAFAAATPPDNEDGEPQEGDPSSFATGFRVQPAGTDNYTVTQIIITRN